jgi:hypothetical protein
MSKMMDECFRARMETLHGRFPLQEFREQFVKQFAENGLVLIQGKAYDCFGDGMTADRARGFIFSEERFIGMAVGLCRRWGFNVERKETLDDFCGKMTGYNVTIPTDYLRRRMSSEAVGRMHTRDRSIIHANTPEGREHKERRERLLEI